MLEIYNDQLVDLLLDGAAPAKPLSISTTGDGNTVNNLTLLPMTSVDDVMEIMKIGDRNRTVAATKVIQECIYSVHHAEPTCSDELIELKVASDCHHHHSQLEYCLKGIDTQQSQFQSVLHHKLTFITSADTGGLGWI